MHVWSRDLSVSLTCVGCFSPCHSIIGGVWMEWNHEAPWNSMTFSVIKPYMGLCFIEDEQAWCCPGRCEFAVATVGAGAQFLWCQLLRCCWKALPHQLENEVLEQMVGAEAPPTNKEALDLKARIVELGALAIFAAQKASYKVVILDSNLRVVISCW